MAEIIRPNENKAPEQPSKLILPKHVEDQLAQERGEQNSIEPPQLEIPESYPTGRTDAEIKARKDVIENGNRIEELRKKEAGGEMLTSKEMAVLHKENTNRKVLEVRLGKEDSEGAEKSQTTEAKRPFGDTPGIATLREKFQKGLTIQPDDVDYLKTLGDLEKKDI